MGRGEFLDDIDHWSQSLEIAGVEHILEIAAQPHLCEGAGFSQCQLLGAKGRAAQIRLGAESLEECRRVIIGDVQGRKGGEGAGAQRCADIEAAAFVSDAPRGREWSQGISVVYYSTLRSKPKLLRALAPRASISRGASRCRSDSSSKYSERCSDTELRGGFRAIDAATPH